MRFCAGILHYLFFHLCGTSLVSEPSLEGYMLFRRVSRIAVATCFMGCCVMVSASQQPSTPLLGAAITAAAGDSQPDNNPPAELRPAIKQKDIKKAIRLVADWQIHRSAEKFNQDWTYAPL